MTQLVSVGGITLLHNVHCIKRLGDDSFTNIPWINFGHPKYNYFISQRLTGALHYGCDITVMYANKMRICALNKL